MTDHPTPLRSPRLYGSLSVTVAVMSIALAAGTLIADAWADRAASQAADEEFYRSAEVFNEIFHEIQEKYVSDVGTRELMEAAIRGMFRHLDAHSQYMGPDTFDQLTQSTQGEFFGIGIHITIRDGVLTVIAPIPGTPAARVGLQAWDRIIEIDGESSEGMNLTEAVRLIKGPRGTQVELRVFRAAEEPGGEGQFFDFAITRDEIEIRSVFHRTVGDDIGYIRIGQFSEETGDDLRDAVRELQGQSVEAMILDLRSNTGGLLRQAIEVADVFLPRDALIVRTEGRVSNQNRRYQSDHDSMTDVPLLVLVNESSASASEIVAGALQDHGRAVIVGPADGVPPPGREDGMTFGKASVQTIEELTSTFSYDEDGTPLPTAIRLTTAHYYTPDGREIHEVGIRPDVHVEVPAGHERQLMMRGLLGEPNAVEETTHRTAVRDGLRDVLDEDEAPAEEEPDEADEAVETDDEAQEDEAPVDSVRRVDFDAAPEEGEEEFRDIVFDEAVRYVRVYLLMRGDVV